MNVDKGSRQTRSVTSGKGLALRAGPVGLGHEAGVEPAGAGRVLLGGRARTVAGTFPWAASAVRRAPRGRVLLRPASNSRLRTGTDQGNPTV